MSKAIQAITLLVGFDADQRAEKFTWDSSPDSTPLTGPHSGTLLLPKGAQLGLKVKGVGDVRKSADNPQPMSGFTIKECCFITQPMIAQIGQPPLKTLFFPASPFLNCKTACVPLAPGFSTAAVSDGNQITVIDTWDSHLSVGTAAGRWTLQFFVTLEIAREGAAQGEQRVFNFDCEVEVADAVQ
ncbi:hypothetical protein [Janthinobacterium sp.]|uniref:hypothetical protein n=1 Tax=Janthinobacterium sp. TaxID=1871054 RepID=UPI00293D269C|nr:hypothetical protein [Janthinobacterium sp.]